MKTYRELLELFDTKIRPRVTMDNSVMFSAFFTILRDPDKKKTADNYSSAYDYQFLATKIGEDNPWDIVFIRGGNDLPAGATAIDALGDLSPKETLAVFSGVKAAFMIWFKSQKPGYFAFTAKSEEASRVKLYKKFAKVLAKTINFNMISGKTGNVEKFIFTKKD